MVEIGIPEEKPGVEVQPVEDPVPRTAPKEVPKEPALPKPEKVPA